MSTVIYYAAMSLDGFIASADGNVDWLDRLPASEDGYGYPDFYASVDALVMGSGTYAFIQGTGSWPYDEKPAWVFSSRALRPMAPGVTNTSAPVDSVMTEIEQAGHRRIWLVGGGLLARSFLDAGLLSELYLTVTPDLLGAGIPFLAPGKTATSLELLEARPYESGVVQVRYAPKMPA